MAAITNATIKVKTAFADETTRELELGPFDAASTAISNAKANIKTFNENISDIAALYISDGGANCTGIIDATVTVETDDPINLNDD